MAQGFPRLMEVWVLLPDLCLEPYSKIGAGVSAGLHILGPGTSTWMGPYERGVGVFGKASGFA